MSLENALDSGFASEQRRIEVEKQPARELLDELRRIIAQSQTPAELGFGVVAGFDEITLSRDGYDIIARVSGSGISFGRDTKVGISVSIGKPGAADFELSVLSILATNEPFPDARAAAEWIGALMARIVEDRIF